MKLLHTIGFVVGLSLSAGAALAEYPEKPITLVVPYAAGGASDVVARTFGEAITRVSGQSVVVENRPGAGGVIAIEHVAGQRPDGYTVLVGNVTTNAITPVFMADKFSVDYSKAIKPVARLALVPALLVASADSGITSLPDLIEKAQAAPKTLRYGSAGVGAYGHFDGVMLAEATGIEAIHVPSTSGAAGIGQSLLSGDTHFSWINVASGLPLVQEGRLVGLGVNTEERLEELPDVPTLAELGYPGHGSHNWQALFVPGGTPDEVVAALHRLIGEAAKQDLVQSTFKRQIILDGTLESTEATRQWIDEEIAHWTKVQETIAKIQTGQRAGGSQ